MHFFQVFIFIIRVVKVLGVDILQYMRHLVLWSLFICSLFALQIDRHSFINYEISQRPPLSIKINQCFILFLLLRCLLMPGLLLMMRLILFHLIHLSLNSLLDFRCATFISSLCILSESLIDSLLV